MSARRIARELAVIVFPQLPREQSRLERWDVSHLVAKAVRMLVDYAKQSLADADALVTRATNEISEIEIEHPDNQDLVENLVPVNVTSRQLKDQLDLIERAIHLVSEALDIPDMALEGGQTTIQLSCKKCKAVNEQLVERPDSNEVRDFLFQLVNSYLEHRDEIDEFIKLARGKWKVERMVSIDRDILRLASAEALYMRDVPVGVAINEAVELTKRFADERAARYINGILGDLAATASNFRKTGRIELSEAAGDEQQESQFTSSKQ